MGKAGVGEGERDVESETGFPELLIRVFKEMIGKEKDTLGKKNEGRVGEI